MRGPIAQGLEQSAHNRKVPGSIPGGPTKFKKPKIIEGKTMSHQSLKKFIDLITFDQQLISLQKKSQDIQKSILQHQAQIQQEEDKKLKSELKEQELQKQLGQQEAFLQELQDKEQHLLKNIEKVSGSREYDAGIKELEHLRVLQSSEEQKLLQMHNKVNNLKKEVASTLEQSKEQILKLEHAIELDKQNLQLLHTELSSIDALRSEKVQGISSDWLEMYEMMRGRVSDPVVPLQQDSCSSCFHGLTPRDLQILRNKGVIQCKGCYRILYEQSVP
jgi:predicted  nucleic acid-binding Zn-ribbon protein